MLKNLGAILQAAGASFDHVVLHTFFTDPEHIIRYAWATRHWAGKRVRSLMTSHPGLTVVRLTSPAEAERWISGPLAAVTADH